MGLIIPVTWGIGVGETKTDAYARALSDAGIEKLNFQYLNIYHPSQIELPTGVDVSFDRSPCAYKAGDIVTCFSAQTGGDEPYQEYAVGMAHIKFSDRALLVKREGTSEEAVRRALEQAARVYGKLLEDLPYRITTKNREQYTAVLMVALLHRESAEDWFNIQR